LLFLPPYSPLLNPIEEVWGFAKNYIARNRPPGSGAFDKPTTERLFIEGLDLASTKELQSEHGSKHMWMAACRHTNEVIKKIYQEIEEEEAKEKQ